MPDTATWRSRRASPCRLPAAIILVLLVAAVARGQQKGSYRILVTNDDGVRAPGLLALVEALTPLGEVFVIAPLENQSGTGHAVTLSDPIFIDQVALPGGRSATALAATPATCVRVALSRLLPAPPDLVVSGINPGFNYGLNAYISGTVAAAREAAMNGIPAAAFSVDAAGQPSFSSAASVAARIVEMVRREGLPPGVFLNVNVPAGPADAIKGLMLARQSRAMGRERYEEQRTPYGRRYLWSVFEQPAGGEAGSDVDATRLGYVAVTPLRAAEFDEGAFEALKGRIR